MGGLLAVACLAASPVAATPARAAAGDCPPGFLNIAHRAPHQTTDENTISAINLAGGNSIEVELDVHQDRDGQEWLMHDATLDRTTNGTGLIRNRSTAYVSSLRTEPRGQEIPTLREGLEAVAANNLDAVYLDLWSPSPTDAYVNDVVAEIRRAGLEDRAYIVKFHARVQRLAPDILRQWKPPAGTTVQQMVSKRVESLAGGHGMMTPEVIQQLHAAGQDQVLIMSVNSRASLLNALSKNADGVMGDTSVAHAEFCGT
jgi:glycerophosphoryl diester phosphodiesterase